MDCSVRYGYFNIKAEKNAFTDVNLGNKINDFGQFLNKNCTNQK